MGIKDWAFASPDELEKAHAKEQQVKQSNKGKRKKRKAIKAAKRMNRGTYNGQ